MGYLLICSATISNFVYIFYVAKSFGEYTQSSYFCSVSILIGVIFTIAISTVKQLFKFIEDCENAVNISEYSKIAQIQMNIIFAYKVLNFIFQPLNAVQQDQYPMEPVNL